MRFGMIGLVKLIAVVIVGLFIAKLASGYVKKKFPNKVTNTIDSVVQTA